MKLIQRRIQHIAIAFGVGALMLYSDVMAALPQNADEVLPDGVASGEPISIVKSLISFSIQLLAYVMMAIAIVGAGYWIFKSFGDSQDTKGGYGQFGVSMVGSLIMVAVVVSLGLVAVDWAKGLSTVAITTS